MANTIKLGAGNWATKENEILAYNDENNNFKPLPFDTTRATTATRVNKDGLIENIAASVPRVDYASGDGALLLEPASTNLITQSEAFGNSYWTKSGASIEPSNTRITGINLLDGYDFTTWNTYFSPTSVTSNSFTSDATKDGVSKDGVIVGSKSYELLITGDTTATSLNVRSNSGEDIKNLTGTFSETIRFQWVDSTDTDFTLSNVGVGTTTITSLQLYEVQGFSAPSVDSPLGAFKLVEDTSTGNHKIENTSGIVDSFQSASIYVKYDNSQQFIQTTSSRSISNYVNFDILNKTFTNFGTSVGKIVELVDGWMRLEVYHDSSNSCYWHLVTSLSGVWSESYTGTGKHLLIFASQLEAQSSATSYIPTAGTIISRTADTASKSGISSLINSSEGVLYAEIARKTGNTNSMAISINDGSTTNAVSAYYFGADSLYVDIFNSSGTVTLSALSIDTSISNKIAVKYKSGDSALWLNGVEVSTDLGLISLVGLNEFSFDYGNTTLPFQGNCKDLRVFNTALTDAELLTLTTL